MLVGFTVRQPISILQSPSAWNDERVSPNSAMTAVKVTPTSTQHSICNQKWVFVGCLREQKKVNGEMRSSWRLSYKSFLCRMLKILGCNVGEENWIFPWTGNFFSHFLLWRETRIALAVSLAGAQASNKTPSSLSGGQLENAMSARLAAILRKRISNPSNIISSTGWSSKHVLVAIYE